MLEAKITIRWIKDNPPPRPGRLSLANTRQIDMTKFGLKFALPVVGASDVVTRELSITVNGSDPVTKVQVGQVRESEEILFDLNDNVTVVLTDIDGSGNRSEPSAPFNVTVTDTVPPPQPGALGVSAVRQVEL